MSLEDLECQILPHYLFVNITTLSLCKYYHIIPLLNWTSQRNIKFCWPWPHFQATGTQYKFFLIMFWWLSPPNSSYGGLKFSSRFTVQNESPSGHLVPKWLRFNIDATSSCPIDVITMSFLHHVPAGSADSQKST